MTQQIEPKMEYKKIDNKLIASVLFLIDEHEADNDVESLFIKLSTNIRSGDACIALDLLIISYNLLYNQILRITQS